MSACMCARMVVENQ